MTLSQKEAHETTNVMMCDSGFEFRKWIIFPPSMKMQIDCNIDAIRTNIVVTNTYKIIDFFLWHAMAQLQVKDIVQKLAIYTRVVWLLDRNIQASVYVVDIPRKNYKCNLVVFDSANSINHETCNHVIKFYPIHITTTF